MWNYSDLIYGFPIRIIRANIILRKKNIPDIRKTDEFINLYFYVLIF